MDIKFRKIESDKDVDFLYEIYSCDRDIEEFSRDIKFSTRDEFTEILMKNLKFYYYEFFIIEYYSVPVGFVYGHNHSPRDLTIRFSLYVLNEYRSCGIGAVAAFKYVKFLFKTLPVRKVYITVFGCNKVSLENNLQAGFVEEAVLKDYIFVNGEFCDLHYLSVSRERFLELCKKRVFNKL